MSSPHLWLRAETKPHEERRALSPGNAGKLVEQGFKLTVEQSEQSIFDDQAYADVGCECVPEGSWPKNAPPESFVLGLKELPTSETPLQHRHIYFAHAYKGQKGWQEILSRFRAGGGQLLDLEYLTDLEGRRVAAFGYWAGFAGAAVAIETWCTQQEGRPLKDLVSSPNQQSLMDRLRATLGNRQPRVIVIGALGRCGQGARAVADQLELETSAWDLEETRRGGPFLEILEHDIFINCVFVNRAIPPFLTKEELTLPTRKLSVICDVSCDPTSDLNPLPIYQSCTDFSGPCLRISDAPVLDLIAIDHLPSLLPAESSDDFSRQLLPSLLEIETDPHGVWSRARTLFTEKIKTLP